MKTDAENYRLWMMLFGIIPTLMVLEHFEKSEQYEECQKIVDAINIHNKHLNDTMPTRMSFGVYDMVKQQYKDFGLGGKFINHQSEVYFKEILTRTEELK